jgi:hypothetical protein
MHAVAQQIANLLAHRSVTFAQLDYATTVKTAAAHKHVNIVKHTSANVQLFANINAATNVYANAVKRSAGVDEFTTNSAYYTHDANCYSIVTHKTSNKQYLFCIYNTAASTYTIDNVAATKQQVAKYLTPSAAKQLLEPASATYNATNNITHNVVMRTISLDNINSITAAKQTVHF